MTKTKLTSQAKTTQPNIKGSNSRAPLAMIVPYLLWILEWCCHLWVGPRGFGRGIFSRLESDGGRCFEASSDVNPHPLSDVTRCPQPHAKGPNSIWHEDEEREEEISALMQVSNCWHKRWMLLWVELLVVIFSSKRPKKKTSFCIYSPNGRIYKYTHKVLVFTNKSLHFYFNTFRVPRSIVFPAPHIFSAKWHFRPSLLSLYT